VIAFPFSSITTARRRARPRTAAATPSARSAAAALRVNVIDTRPSPTGTTRSAPSRRTSRSRLRTPAADNARAGGYSFGGLPIQSHASPRLHQASRNCTWPDNWRVAANTKAAIPPYRGICCGVLSGISSAILRRPARSFRQGLAADHMSGLGGSQRRPCRGQRQPRQSLRSGSCDRKGDAGSLSRLPKPLQGTVPLNQRVIHPPAPVVPARPAAGERAGPRFLELAVIICASEGRGST
jgi:hypothetical protein